MRVIQEFNDVKFVQDEEVVVKDIRLVEVEGTVTEEGVTMLEVAEVCKEDKETNWILLGTDPGEYRCVRCTSWL